MKLSPEGIKHIKKPIFRPQVAMILRRSDQTVVDYIKENRDNGPLTAYGVIEALCKETGLTPKEVLTENLIEYE